jgi:aspartyl-tRNA(Asn)/glutamyl-tRNA(Gln) amidotransferase subunit C
MPVTREQVLAMAALCRIDLVGDRLDRMTARLDAVVGHLDILRQVNTEGVEPLYAPLEHGAPPRKDVAEKHLTSDDILANAPKRQQNFFVVPPVI